MNFTLFVGQFKYYVGCFYTKGASRSYYICFVTTGLGWDGSRWTTTASFADASHLLQPRS